MLSHNLKSVCLPRAGMSAGGVSGKHHSSIIAGFLMPENPASCSNRLCTIYSFCGALYLARTGSTTETGENQAFKKQLSWNKRKFFKCL